MEQSLYADFVRTFFPTLVTSVVEKLNDRNAQTLPYLYKDLLTPEYTSDSRWASVLAKYNRVSADVVALDSELPVKSRDSIEVVSGDIPKIGMQMYLTEKQMKDVAAMIATSAPRRRLWTRFSPTSTRHRGRVRDHRGHLPFRAVIRCRRSPPLQRHGRAY